jgi:curved DNA-binding protein CbpA
VPPRPTLPPDDLYTRLEISVDASPEAIEVAWRSLLRQHHPDIAGPSGLERSKRINVAHDWLSDPELRTRYDHERGLRRSLRETGGRDPRDDGRAARSDGRTVRHAARPRPTDPAEALARFLDRVAALDPDEVDRLACAEPPPIAFGATIARFLPPDRLAALEAAEAAIATRLDPVAAALPGVRDAVEGYATELVLGTFLDDLLTEPFRDRARERLTRGWEAAVGQPRYGPNGVAVRGLLGRLASLDGAGVAALAATARRAGYGDGTSEDPWPPGASPDDDEALRVSSMLAARDASDAVPSGAVDRATAARARWSAARLAHLLVLRHAFTPRVFASLTRPWRPRFLPDDQPAPRVHRPVRR